MDKARIRGDRDINAVKRSLPLAMRSNESAGQNKSGDKQGTKHEIGVDA